MKLALELADHYAQPSGRSLLSLLDDLPSVSFGFFSAWAVYLWSVQIADLLLWGEWASSLSHPSEDGIRQRGCLYLTNCEIVN